MHNYREVGHELGHSVQVKDVIENGNKTTIRGKRVIKATKPFITLTSLACE